MTVAVTRKHLHSFARDARVYQNKEKWKKNGLNQTLFEHVKHSSLSLKRCLCIGKMSMAIHIPRDQLTEKSHSEEGKNRA